MQGLAENKDELGAPLCPCRHYDDKQAEALQGFWNCPCVPMRERRVRLCLLDSGLDGSPLGYLICRAPKALNPVRLNADA